MTGIVEAGPDDQPGDLITQDAQIEWNGLLMGPGTWLGYAQNGLTGWDQTPEVVRDTAAKLNGDGTFAGDIFYNERSVSFTAQAYGDDFTSLRAACNRHFKRSNTPQPLIVRQFGQSLFIYARLLGFGAVINRLYFQGVPQYQIQWVAEDPLKYGLSEKDVTLVSPYYIGGLQYPLQYPLDYGGFSADPAPLKNYYPDPGQEYGILPYPAAATSGAATLSADATEKHSGVQSIKITNTTPAVTAAINLFPDPGNEYGGASLWAATAGSTVANDATHVRSGAKSLLITTAPGQGGQDASITIPVEAGKTYTYSAWVWNPTGTGSSSGYAIRFAGALPATNGPLYSTFGRDSWVQHSITATATITGNAVLYLYLANTPGIQVWFDDFGFCEGAVPVDFSGDTPDAPGVDYAWAGVAGNSSSTRTPVATAVNYFTGVSVATPADLGLDVGDDLTFSTWVKLGQAASYAYLGAIAGTAVGSQVLIPTAGLAVGVWTHVWVTAQVANATGSLVPRLYGGASPGDITHYDDFGLAPGDQPVDFSGDSTDPDYLYAWEGTPGDSTSTRYLAGTGQTVTNDGNEPAPIVLTVPGPIDGFQLVNGEDATLDVDSPLADGETLQIDTRTGQVLRNGVEISGASILADDSVPIETWRLPVGDSTVRFTEYGNDGVQGGPQATMTWHDTYN